MKPRDANQLAEKRCAACEGGVQKLTPAQVQDYLALLKDWRLIEGGNRIRKQWTVKDFMAGIDFFDRVAVLAESEGHHPDLHLEGYRTVSIDLWTHAIGGLSENDFILAAKIEQIPVLTKD
jgi:4a-hydroxytetrahydrobiopterin dehydratase